jgi:hypothetical protein
MRHGGLFIVFFRETAAALHDHAGNRSPDVISSPAG